MHSRNFTDASLAQGKRLLIVGGGKSALDCAVEATLSNLSKRITLLTRQVGRLWQRGSSSSGAEHHALVRAAAILLDCMTSWRGHDMHAT